MENVTNIINDKKFINNKIVLDNRNKITISGVEKALSSNENGIVLKVSGKKLFIGGKNLQIGKLDVENGLFEAEGEVYSVKFEGSEKGGLVKRIFK